MNTMLRKLITILTLASLIAAPGLAHQTPSGSPGKFVITENGKTPSGESLYMVIADRVDAADLARELAIRAKSIAPALPVRSLVSVSMTAVTASQALDQVRKAALANANSVGVVPTKFIGPNSPALQKLLVRTAESGTGLDQIVSFAIPDSQPITLGAALQMLERQTGVALRLDKSINAEIKFSGTVSAAPLKSILQSMAPGSPGGLKHVVMRDGVLIAPSDSYQVFVGSSVLGSTSTCPRCKLPLLFAWNFCPRCGQVSSRGMTQGLQSAPVPKKPAAPNNE